jgi:hypothetical protein
MKITYTEEKVVENVFLFKDLFNEREKKFIYTSIMQSYSLQIDSPIQVSDESDSTFSFTNTLRRVKSRIEKVTETEYNLIILNLCIKEKTSHQDEKNICVLNLGDVHAVGIDNTFVSMDSGNILKFVGRHIIVRTRNSGIYIEIKFKNKNFKENVILGIEPKPFTLKYFFDNKDHMTTRIIYRRFTFQV